ncbi:cyclic lactone autoinducer peptide [Xylanibacillus composti]|uniref:Cyclic lactone autoinducer peptide n=1 Tax=Xylanibacillus composti TaxID=1572762 RepID=A0A8J4H5Z4_9BACL|nr:cyclic lactone autoinducer peptide [Xylanibacillus composti]GIQ71459.1 hypothetical protein XYCOK13_42830 [Xylanibacillus composti]
MKRTAKLISMILFGASVLFVNLACIFYLYNPKVPDELLKSNK